ncbi:MAG: ABC transporter ATP-binding protein/permease [Clostridia bacterium]|nr:ABC transporter ATP-binding protein/permease [Clostridia bacterium]
MLTLTGITKDYGTGEDAVHALQGVSLNFRPNEFVAILGPSGCGKTTLLNIIGGLDKYTEGDLVIEGTSTKEYGDRDWDTYRNHSVGFVFQSYNLIPHQTVLSNVELALTLSGVSRQERRVRAQAALESVGLGNQAKKKPTQMSGGQMQRVAIARALVNNPRIILADEPTGALDTATSEQIMEILSAVAHEKLIIMVTHNPELAERYATRIIRVVDGRVVDDSNPYDGVSEEPIQVAPKDGCDNEEALCDTDGAKPQSPSKKRKKKTSMSFWTALSLSLNNLLTKKTRTLLTSIAGSIGIIGIALVLALSNGIQLFIDQVQEDTLSSYPIAIETGTMDMNSLLTSIAGDAGDKEIINGYITSNNMLASINKSILQDYKENDLAALKAHIESDASKIRDNATVQYVYSPTPQIYKLLPDGTYHGVNPSTTLNTLMTFMGMENSAASSMMNAWSEMIDNPELLKDQYKMLSGKWPSAYDEVVLVADENHQISDLMLYALGVKDPDEFLSLFTEVPEETETSRYSYADLLALRFQLVLAADYYEKNDDGSYSDIRETEAELTDMINTRGIDIKVVGIVAPNPDATATSISGTVGYTSALTRYIIERTTAKAPDGTYVYPVVGEQLENEGHDVITNTPFYERDTSPTDVQADKFRAWYATATNAQKAEQYAENLANAVFLDLFSAQMQSVGMSYSYPELLPEHLAAYASYPDQAAAEVALRAAVTSLMEEDPTLYNRLKTQYPDMLGTLSVDAFRDEVVPTLPYGSLTVFLSAMRTYEGGAYDAAYKTAKNELANMGQDDAAAAYDVYVTKPGALNDGEEPQDGAEYSSADTAAAGLWDTYLRTGTSLSTYKENLRMLGIADLDSPTAIYLYPTSFDAKEAISAEIAEYNKANPDKEITYTDYIGILLSSISIILDVITYVLVAFVSISLVVSSIMIGIITYISVLERIKEIGILRAVGASKRDVSRVFLAETLIVGFTAGMIGILTTLLLCLPINAIIRALSGFQNLGAALPFVAAVVLVLISMALTLIAGVIPAKIAARKEPVEALRSE